MKNENSKYFIVGLIVLLAALAWHYWDKLKVMAVAAKAAASSGSGSGTAPVAAAPATIAAQTTPGTDNGKYYPYGSGKIYFEDRNPSTYKAEILSFTPDLKTKSAFK